MINKSISCFITLIACYFNIHLMLLVINCDALVCSFKFPAGSSQYVLQLVSTGSIFRTVSASVSPSVLGYIINVIHNICAVCLFLWCNVGSIVCLIGTDINGAVLDSVGIVHIGFRKDDSISYICGSTIQTLVSRQTTRLVQTEVVLQAGIAEAEIVSTFVALVLKWESLSLISCEVTIAFLEFAAQVITVHVAVVGWIHLARCSRVYLICDAFAVVVIIIDDTVVE